jgi:hypothetical protein
MSCVTAASDDSEGIVFIWLAVEGTLEYSVLILMEKVGARLIVVGDRGVGVLGLEGAGVLEDDDYIMI